MSEYDITEGLNFEEIDIEEGFVDTADSFTLDNAEYRPPSLLKFSPAVEEAFLEKGYKLKWVNRSPTSIRKRLNPQEGYTFVKPTELSAEELIMLGSSEDDPFYGGAHIINGDLILMKVRVERNEARKKYYHDKTQAQSQAIEQRLREQDIDSNSRSVVRTGKNAHFRS